MLREMGKGLYVPRLVIVILTICHPEPSVPPIAGGLKDCIASVHIMLKLSTMFKVNIVFYTNSSALEYSANTMLSRTQW